MLLLKNVRHMCMFVILNALLFNTTFHKTCLNWRLINGCRALGRFFYLELLTGRLAGSSTIHIAGIVRDSRTAWTRVGSAGRTEPPEKVVST